MADTQDYTNESILDFFKSGIQTQSAETQSAYGRVIKAMGAFLSGHDLHLADISETMVVDWVVELLRSGLSPKNVKKYVDILGSLLNSGMKAGILPPNEAVKKAKLRFTDTPEDIDQEWVDTFTNRFLNLMRVRAEVLKTDSNPDAPIWRDVILFSLLNGAMNIADVARLTKDGYHGGSEEALAVVGRNASPTRRKYIFDLRQSSMTPKQLEELVAKKTLELLRDKVSPRLTDTRSAILSMWVELAMRGGATASMALGCHPSFTSVCLPAFAGKSAVEESLKAEIIKSVASEVISNPLRWYAMRLRSRVTVEDIEKSITETALPWKPAETFYPMEAITKASGKKRQTVRQPYICDVLFFKSRVTDILPLFRHIGDKAWCYRVTNAPGAPYAAIPQADMTRFQIAIGEFAPGTEVHPLGTIELSPGDEVVVLGGLLAGKTGIFDRKVTDRKSGRILYRVILQQVGKDGKAEGYEWEHAKKIETEIDPRQLRKNDKRIAAR